MTHAAEWGRFYDREGNPVYEVPYADPSKGMRAVSLADARKLKFVPSVTTILREAAKPGLERWKQEQVLLAALTLPRGSGEAESDWIRRVFEDSEEQARKAAERGTQIHAAIQQYYETGSADSETWEYVSGAIKEIAVWIKGEVKSETSFAHALGYGGKIDLYSVEPILEFECGMVTDFKTKEFGFDDKLKTWPEHHMQLAAYREGLKLPKAKCAICYVSTTTPGLSRLIEVPEEDLQQGWLMFKTLLDYYYARTGLKRD